jgi:S-DNA-T family DNA segregation ATPase FtsK/SpoIIIE
MFVVLSANHERGVPSRLAGQIQSRLVMRMADPTSYTAFGLRTRDIPELGRGRAIDVASGAEVQIAQAAAVAPGPGQEPRCPGRAGGPPPLRCLANDVAPEGLVDRSRELKGGLSLVIGRRHRDLEPATLGLRAGTNLIVSGPPGSGKTTALRALAAAALAADPAGQTIVIGPQEEWPGGVEQLGADLIDAERRSLVLIDGLAAIDDAGAQAIDRAAAGSTWIVVADRPEVLAAPPHWLRRITASRTGLLLQPAFDHGEVLRCRLPLRSSSPGSFPPGRGFLVEAGSVELVQVVNAGRSTVPHRPGPGDGVGAAGAASGRGVRLR